MGLRSPPSPGSTPGRGTNAGVAQLWKSGRLVSGSVQVQLLSPAPTANRPEPELEGYRSGVDTSRIRSRRDHTFGPSRSGPAPTRCFARL